MDPGAKASGRAVVEGWGGDVREAAALLPDLPTDTAAELAAETLDGAGNLDETEVGDI